MKMDHDKCEECEEEGKGNYIESGQPFFVYKLHREWSRPISVIGKKENLCVFYFSFFLKLHRERSRPISVIGQKKRLTTLDVITFSP